MEKRKSAHLKARPFLQEREVNITPLFKKLFSWARWEGMAIKNHCLLFLCLLVTIPPCSAQKIPDSPNTITKKGKRSGEWTIWYTKDWNITLHSDSAAYYRRITYQRDKPTGVVKDYYKSGTLQWEGILLSDRPEDIIDGKAIWYDELGNKEKETEYKKGKLLSEVIYKKDSSEHSSSGRSIESNWAELNRIGEQYYDEGEYQKSLEVFKQAKIEAEKVSIAVYPHYILALTNLALLYETLGYFQHSEPLYEQALQLTEKAIGKDNIEYGAILNNLALLYERMGNYQKAEPLFKQDLQISEKTLGRNHPDYATGLHNLANLYESMGQYQKVEPLLLEALQISEKALGKDHPDYAVTLHNLAMLYQRKGDYLKAESLFEQDLQITEKVLGKDHPDYASSLNNLGLLYYAMENYQKAYPLYLQSLSIREKLLGKTHPHYVFTLGNLADLHRREGQYGKAGPLLTEVNEQMLRQIEKVYPALSEKEKSYFYKTFSARFESFHSFVLLARRQTPELVAEMFNNQLAIKASLFNATSKVRQHILGSQDQALISLFGQWQEKKNYLAKIYQLTKQEKQERDIDEKKLEEEANALEKQLSLQSEPFATTTDKKRYSWQDVQKKLKAKEACVEMVRFRWVGETWTDTVYYAALIVTPASTLPELILLENGNDLEGKYASFYGNAIRKGLFAKGVEDVRIDSLYHHYWGKIATYLRKEEVEKVYFAPDGVYNRINLNTLYNPQTKQFILDELDIHLLTSCKDLVKEKHQIHPVNSATLFGYPDYNGAIAPGQNQSASSGGIPTDELKKTWKGPTLPMLPGTQKEIDTIESLLTQHRIIVNKFIKNQASEEAIKNINNPGLLHIATHGFFMAETESSKGDPGMVSAAEDKPSDNPLLQTGLYLAGAQKFLDSEISGDSTENGVLTAFEAMNLNLDNTELVVLSACETGLGEIKNGEGVYGLQRAFQTAGAKSVLMSLWKVDDKATGELMSSFYEQWLKVKNKREAFKVAQQKLRIRYGDPYFWGAFVMVGD